MVEGRVDMINSEGTRGAGVLGPVKPKIATGTPTGESGNEKPVFTVAAIPTHEQLVGQWQLSSDRPR